jgi:NitT/TauT family transport system permease protein
MAKRIAELAGAFLAPLVLPLLLLAVWSLAAQELKTPVILPEPGAVFTRLAHPLDDVIAMGSLPWNVAFSLARVLAGFLLAVLAGVPLGLAMGYFRTADQLLTGIVSLLRAIPPLAWIPVVLGWCGLASLESLFSLPIGPLYAFLHNIKWSMICIIFIGGIYPVLTSAMHGVRQIPATLVESARMLGAGHLDVFCKVLLPASVPAVVGGMRIALGMCWMCVVAAEMMPGTPIGLGCMIMQAFSIGATDVVIAGMICIGSISALMDWIFRRWEARFLFWRQETR